MDGTPLGYHAHEERGCWIVCLEDDVDHATVPYWKQVLDGLAGGARVAIDLRAVRYLDSAGIALLLWLRRHLVDRQGSLALVHGPRFLDRILRIAGIPSLIPCFPDVPAALDGLGRAASPAR